MTINITQHKPDKEVDINVDLDEGTIEKRGELQIAMRQFANIAKNLPDKLETLNINTNVQFGGRNDEHNTKNIRCNCASCQAARG